MLGKIVGEAPSWADLELSGPSLATHCMLELSLLRTAPSRSLRYRGRCPDSCCLLQRNSAMAEIFGIAASAASFIGLAGQILQGCQNIRSFLDDFKDAKSNLHDLVMEMDAFESALKCLRGLLTEIENSGIDVALSKESIILALKCSDKAVHGLGVLISRHEERGGWRVQIAIALGKERLGKHLQALERAKLHLLVAQANITIAISYTNSRSLASSTVTITTSAETISSLSSRPEELHGPFNSSADTSLSVKQNRPTQWDSLQPILKGLIEHAVGNALNEHCFHCYDYDPTREDHEEEVLSQSFADNGISQITSPKIGRSRWMRHMKTWFGTLVFSSVETSYEYRSETSFMFETNSRVFQIEIVPNRLLIRLGLLLTFHQPCLSSDMRMRVYNIVAYDSPIVQACRNGALEEVQLLFAKGEASPFDKVCWETNLLDMVLTHMCNQWQKCTYLSVHSSSALVNILELLERLAQINNFLIQQGLDPTKSSTSDSPYLGWLLDAAMTCEYTEALPILANTARPFISQSMDDPALRLTLEGFNWWGEISSPLSPLKSLSHLISAELDRSTLLPNFKLQMPTTIRRTSPEIRTAIMHDAQALGVQKRLKQLKCAGRVDGSSKILLLIMTIPKTIRRKGFCSHYKESEVMAAAEKHVAVGIEFGLRPTPHYPLDSVHLRMYVNNNQKLRRLALRNGWDPDSIPEWAEAESTSSLALQLYYLHHHKHQWVHSSLTIRKRLKLWYITHDRLRGEFQKQWMSYLEEYNQKVWDFQLPGFEPPRWSLSPAFSQNWIPNIDELMVRKIDDDIPLAWRAVSFILKVLEALLFLV